MRIWRLSILISVIGLAATGADERPERAAKFPGGEGVAVVVSDAALPLPGGAFTVEAWVNPRETTEHAGILSKAEKSGFVMSIKAGMPRFKIHSEGEYRKVEAGAPLGSRRWTHMAGVYDGKEVRLYLAGSLVATAEAPGTMTATNLPTLVGADPDGEGKAQMGFDGLIDEVRVSDGVRYEGRRFEPQRRFVRDAATLVLLHFDEEVGDTFRSDDDGGRHGERVGEVALVEVDE